MTLFDLAAITLGLLCGIAGLSAGAVRELVGLFAFGLAIAGAVLLLPVSRPAAQALIQPSWAGTFAAMGVVFLAAYLGLQLGGRVLTAGLRTNGVLGGLDRLGGAGIGLLKAMAVLGVFWLGYRAVTPPEFRPPWIEKATLLPFARAAGGVIAIAAPQGVRRAETLGPLFQNALGGGDALRGENLTDITDDADPPAAAAKPPAHEPTRPTRHTTAAHGREVVGGRSR